MKSSDGIVLLNKPPGVTSFKALSDLKKIFKKVGHTGTLDKFAEGLLVVLCGSFTKLNPLFTPLDKKYRAVITFGSETDTLDPEGVIIATGEIPSYEAIEASVAQFRGTFRQEPPLYSALHLAGQRAHKLARKGVSFNLTPREVTVYASRIVAWQSPNLTLEVACSKGTYIRSLARDIALRAHSRAHLTQLKRLEVGPFRVEEALDDYENLAQHISKSSAHLRRLGSFADFIVDERGQKSLSYANIPSKSSIVEAELPLGADKGLVMNTEGELLAVVKLNTEGEISGIWAVRRGE
ncbi:MAG: tRNA pseudouridine(55) synthase TruB [Sphaerochaetaceae bacterium]